MLAVIDPAGGGGGALVSRLAKRVVDAAASGRPARSRRPVERVKT
jgi:hypothetical protein